jgi:hypothetical protein
VGVAAGVVIKSLAIGIDRTEMDMGFACHCPAPSRFSRIQAAAPSLGMTFEPPIFTAGGPLPSRHQRYSVALDFPIRAANSSGRINCSLNVVTVFSSLDVH